MLEEEKEGPVVFVMTEGMKVMTKEGKEGGREKDEIQQRNTKEHSNSNKPTSPHEAICVRYIR